MEAGKPANLAFAALRAEFDPMYAQEWWNSKLGLTFVAKGAKINDSMIEERIKNFTQRQLDNDKIRTFGMDVGYPVSHIVVKEWCPVKMDYYMGVTKNDLFYPRVILAEEVEDKSNAWEKAEEIFRDMRCYKGVCDAEPERRNALRFCQKLYGRMLSCDYLHSQTGRTVSYNEEELMLKVNRTSWLDLALGRYKSGAIELHRTLVKRSRITLKNQHEF